ncbi:MAG: tRNA (N(6)-L-threonylcarbamoyladenosine(37)-C(2))-methylthiotransferase MtaB [Planctomycetaceae bacterium]|nr:tRNA (N(6)-L-threonylcarbamoyladenosine(37)-C(2))-methylthiotransferase MtaB [Planctomycetaceae bacterium]
MPATLKTVTLGCKVNQYETEYIREGLLGVGYEDAANDRPADLCVVNTCTVTNEGDSKSRQIIRRLARDNPDTRIVVMGCYATRAPDEVAALPNVVEVVTDKRELPDLLGRFGVVDIPTGISQFGGRHRAYVKVQDGCLLRCSYCIIPKVRPSLYSRPTEHILDEVRRLLDNGYRELVLTGVHLGHYGVDWNQGRPKSEWVRLSDLLRRIVQLDGDFRVRLSSIEATEVTRELVAVMSEFGKKICPHLHICLQSGSDRILRRMKRRWGTKRFIDRCRLVAETLDKPAFTTDVIIGFPGETDEDFEATCNTVRQVGFSKIHTFPFSPRRETPAAEMSDMVPKRIKSERGSHLAEIESQLRGQYFNGLLKTKLRVLVESVGEQSPERVVGTSCRYAPVELVGSESLQGSLVDFTPMKLLDGVLHGAIDLDRCAGLA